MSWYRPMLFSTTSPLGSATGAASAYQDLAYNAAMPKVTIEYCVV